jgi:hypothetical protein
MRARFLVSIIALMTFSGAARASFDETLKNRCSDARAKYKIPALAIHVTRHGLKFGAASEGLRSVDQNVGVTDSDEWHLGSDTKAMTAYATALLAPSANSSILIAANSGTNDSRAAVYELLQKTIEDLSSHKP